MSIKLKLLIGCLCLTIITMIVGAFAQHSQRRIGDLAVQIYDDALLSTNALRSAQNSLLRLDTRFRFAGIDNSKAALSPAEADYLQTEFAGILADLMTASDGAISPEGKDTTTAIRGRLMTLSAADGVLTGRLLRHDLDLINQQIDAAVRIFAADAYGVRRDVGTLIETSVDRTWIAMGIAALLALLISFALSRSIVPAVKNAMNIAKSIASGNFENKINAKGRSETAELLTALSVMQESIAKYFGQIENKAATLADAYDGQIALQNVRFEAALNNMTQGLCMFDAKFKLVVLNKRFSDMFGSVEIGTRIEVLAKTPSMRTVLAARGKAFFTQDLADGRMIAVSRQPIEAGGLVVTFEDVTERHEAALQLSHMANHDALTGLPNRLQLRERLEAVLQDAAGSQEAAVLCLDLDGFKFVNDTLGHPVGDMLLKAVGERLRASIGEGDLAARIGGDEFAIIQMSGPQPEAAEALAQKLIAALSVSFDIAPQRVSVGVSIGIVTVRSATGNGSPDADILMKSADLALYAAKSLGRNTYRFFETSMDEEVQVRRRTEVDLGSAIENGEFELFYQPFVNMRRRSIVGFEALVRWRHPVRGMVSPAEFIPIAEDIGMIEPLGLWVLDTACRQAALWPSDLSVAVNLSPVQFRSQTLLADVKRILTASGLPPARLQLEVTESVLLHDTEGVLAILNGFRRLGIGISMDDFGTGYSSLAYLSRFPFDKVKIDQSFVKDLTKRENLAVVRAVVGLSKAMGIAVIAEGVETREQMDVLLAESCEDMQGYHFSPPRPVSDLPQLLLKFGLAAANPDDAASVRQPRPARRSGEGTAARP